MYSKILALITALALTVLTAPPVKVNAQSLVEVAIGLVVMAFGPGEIGELHWVNTSQGNPQKPTIQPGDFPNRYFTIVMTDTGDPTCTQTIQAQVTAHPGLINTLTLAKKGDKLVINGEESEDDLISCISDASRNAYLLGVPFPPGLENLTSAEANALALDLLPVRIVSYTITDDNGGTRAFTIVGNHLKSKSVSGPGDDEAEQ